MIHWNASPELISTSTFHLRWYGILFAGGFLVGHRLFRRICAEEGKPVEAVDLLVVWLLIGTIVGARLAHCLIYEPDYYLAHPLEILAVWKGGLASHGGGLGVISVLLLFSLRYREFPFTWLLDRIAILVALAGAFIRLGNLMNSEIIGRPTEVPWAFVFERVDRLPRHPAQLYESACYFLTALGGWLIYRHFRRNPPPLLLFGGTLAAIFTARFAIEFVKENQEAFEAGLPLNLGQLLSIPFILVGVLLFVNALRSRRQSGRV